MAVSSLVTGGVGPGSSIPLLLTGGLSLAEPPAGTPPESAGVKRSGLLKGVGRMLPRCIILFALLLT